MASLFKAGAALPQFTNLAGGKSAFPAALTEVPAFEADKDERVKDILGITKEEKKRAVADLARSNYEQYLSYKQKMWGDVQALVVAHFKSEAARWKNIGESEEKAVEKAKISAKKYKESLYGWYDELFSLKGKVVETYDDPAGLKKGKKS